MSAFKEQALNLLINNRHAYDLDAVAIYQKAIEKPVLASGHEMKPYAFHTMMAVEKDKAQSGYIDSGFLGTLIIGPQIVDFTAEDFKEIIGHDQTMLAKLEKSKNDIIALNADPLPNLRGHSMYTIASAAYFMISDTDASIKNLSNRKGHQTDVEQVKKFKGIAGIFHQCGGTLQSTEAAFNQRLSNIQQVANKPWNKRFF